MMLGQFDLIGSVSVELRSHLAASPYPGADHCTSHSYHQLHGYQEYEETRVLGNY